MNTQQRLTIAVLTMLLTASLAVSAQAQQTPPDEEVRLARAGSTAVANSAAPAVKPFNLSTKTPAWKVNFSKQFAMLLRSRDASIRAQMLQNVIELAMLHDDKRDFTPLVPALLDVYERDRVEAHRIMALSALHTIGDPACMEYLRKRVATEWEPSKRVYRYTLAMLYDYDQRTQAEQK